MEKVSVSDGNLFASDGNTVASEEDSAKAHNHSYGIVSALADHHLPQRLQSLAARDHGGDPERETSPDIAGGVVFAGGRVFLFGPFRLFPSTRLLMENGRQVQIGSRAFDILTILVDRAGEVISKDKLIDLVWPKVFVDDSNLKMQVSALRRALGEGHAGRRFIATVHGRGYSFVAPVSFEWSRPHGVAG